MSEPGHQGGSIILTIVRLRWAFTMAVLRNSPWQIVGFVIGTLAAFAMVTGVGVGSWFIGGSSVFADPQRRMVLQSLTVLCGTFAVVFTIFIQLMFIGEGSTLSLRRFSLYGIADRRLQAGLLLASLCGIASIAGALTLMLLALMHRSDPASAVVALLAGPPTMVTIISLSKAVQAIATTLVNSRRGQSSLYLAVMVLFILATQLPNIILNGRFDAARMPTAVTGVLAWTPLGAGFQMPFDAWSGDWAALALRLLILAATCAACFAIGLWCLRHERLTAGKAGRTMSTRGIGSFARVPDSPSGAVSARLVMYMLRDPRQLLTLLMPPLFVLIYALQSGRSPGIVWAALYVGALFLTMNASNGLAYDGRGLTMQAITGASGLQDRIGRLRVIGALGTVYQVVIAAVCAMMSGSDLGSALLQTALGLALFHGGLGLAQVTSCVLIYPVPSIDRPFSSPQGRSVAQVFMPMAQMVGTAVVLLPTGLATLALMLSGGLPRLMWVLGAVALINGLGALVLGTVLGGRIMDARLSHIVATLDRFASLQR